MLVIEQLSHREVKHCLTIARPTFIKNIHSPNAIAFHYSIRHFRLLGKILCKVVIHLFEIRCFKKTCVGIIYMFDNFH